MAGGAALAVCCLAACLRLLLGAAPLPRACLRLVICRLLHIHVALALPAVALRSALVLWLRMQEVTDAEGRRRFHGAFTGGWSAGYFNTGGLAGGLICWHLVAASCWVQVESGWLKWAGGVGARTALISLPAPLHPLPLQAVGSKEGWQPSEFRSSRGARAAVQQSVEQFLDEDELEELRRTNLQAS